VDCVVAKEPIVLITGINGQDGSYLAELLVKKGYKVFGTTRDPAITFSLNLRHLVNYVTLLCSNYEVQQLVKIIHDVKPTEIYNFAGQSYVSKSWDMVEETIFSHGVITSRLLEAILITDPSIRFLQASSSEIFTPASNEILNERSRVSPNNPYGCSKIFAHSMVDTYRNTRGLFAVNAILFPHESPRRHANFAFMKIVRAAVSIKLGNEYQLKLGNLDVFRDWGYAPEYVDAMHRMLTSDTPEDYCLCTGKTNSVSNIVELAFGQLDLNWKLFVETSPNLIRFNEPDVVVGDATKVMKNLDWIPRENFGSVVKRAIDMELSLQSGKEKDYRNEHPRFN